VVVPPPSPLPGKYVSAHYATARAGAKAVFDRPEIFQILEHIYYVGYWERVKDFFDKPPEHDLEVGMLVTCTCHGGLAIVLELYDEAEEEYPGMNMAKIWWIKSGNITETRIWMHTIARLNICTEPLHYRRGYDTIL
jgi:hypothetical protein